MKALIVEDSRLAREGLKALLKEFDLIEVVGEAEGADEGAQLVAKYKPDVIFLDIDMPGKSGFEMLADIKSSPFVIFTTAFSEYAVKSFDFNTIDYLLKPIEPDRLKRSVEKLKSKVNEDPRRGVILDEGSRLFVRDGDQSFLVELGKVRKFESCGNYTRIFFDGGSPFIYKSLSKVEQRLPSQVFFRVNRQQIVNLKCVSSVDEGVSGAYVLSMNDGEEVVVSRNRSAKFREFFSL